MGQHYLPWQPAAPTLALVHRRVSPECDWQRRCHCPYCQHFTKALCVWRMYSGNRRAESGLATTLRLRYKYAYEFSRGLKHVQFYDGIYPLGPFSLRSLHDIRSNSTDTYTWSYDLRQNSIGTFSSTGIYHPATETLYIFGGLRYTTNQNVFQYHVPSDLWFLGQSQTPDQSRLYNTVALVANDEAVFFGGQLPYTEGIDEETNQCYFGEIDVYDLGE
ncbi:hypothetical protein BC937DRAFT_87175 [Endogone sp. FLAS-F59071]|nr:hypothetical protein BC937DRAFT_87175 [Endogone sp. FLAS-F59071]|eukprot:RUS12725.1 hypothetical protein BC937DRAFT_87175 [Endogone sp. FLAS-F59071]